MPTVPFRLLTPKRRLHTPGHLVWRKRSHIDVKYVVSGIRTWTVWNITNRILHHAIPNSSSLRAALWTLVEASCRDKTSTLLGLGFPALAKNSYEVLFLESLYFLLLWFPMLNRLFLTASSLCIWFNERFGDGVLWSLGHVSLGCGLTTDQSFWKTYCYFSLFWVIKNFSVFIRLGFKNLFVWERKSVYVFFQKGGFVLLVFPFSTHTYHLADPFLRINSFGKLIYVLGYYGHRWARNSWSLRVRHCFSLLVVHVLFFYFSVQSVKCQFQEIGSRRQFCSIDRWCVPGFGFFSFLLYFY